MCHFSYQTPIQDIGLGFAQTITSSLCGVSVGMLTIPSYEQCMSFGGWWPMTLGHSCYLVLLLSKWSPIFPSLFIVGGGVCLLLILKIFSHPFWEVNYNHEFNSRRVSVEFHTVSSMIWWSHHLLSHASKILYDG
ncbi:hypothetical protein L1049_003266 [Liquidambar formosana]|uniref:Uncharacterized protein n=1 Tax=Liquidambar formosana TaxID=63359 RepID=A0AAP0NJE9_LIQFO